MSVNTHFRRKSFTVGFQNLASWSVSAQFAAAWNWPDQLIRPLCQILARRSEAALDTLSPAAMATLLTIHFDGSVEPRAPVQIKNIKGKLFRAYSGDVVFSKIDVRNGAIGLAPNDIENMCVTSEFPVYSVKTDKAIPGYVKLLFRTMAFRKVLDSMISGASGRKRRMSTSLRHLGSEFKLPLASPQVG